MVALLEQIRILFADLKHVNNSFFHELLEGQSQQCGGLPQQIRNLPLLLRRVLVGNLSTIFLHLEHSPMG
jgi:hypothetical protein